MICPNCYETLTEQTLDHQKVLHCKNCGGCFFEENGINRISVSHAQQLAFDKHGNFVFSHEYVCPKDKLAMEQVQHDEAVPSTAQLYKCIACHGIFSPAESLLIFKQAQKAKIEYFKLWNQPLPSVRSVLVASMVALVSVSVLGGYLYFQQPTTPTQAQDVVKNVHTTASGRYLFVSFKTEIPVTSRILFTDTTTGKTLDRVIQPDFSTLHYLTATDIDLNHSITYHIIVRDTKGHEIKTKETKLEVK